MSYGRGNLRDTGDEHVLWRQARMVSVLALPLTSLIPGPGDDVFKP